MLRTQPRALRYSSFLKMQKFKPAGSQPRQLGEREQGFVRITTQNALFHHIYPSLAKLVQCLGIRLFIVARTVFLTVRFKESVRKIRFKLFLRHDAATSLSSAYKKGCFRGGELSDYILMKEMQRLRSFWRKQYLLVREGKRLQCTEWERPCLLM